MLANLAYAKNVTVLFNFPEEQGADIVDTVSVSEDANAFTAIVLAAEENSTALDATYYDCCGFFLNAVNGVFPGTNEYWAFFINYVYSTEYGMSSYTPNHNDIVEFAIVGFDFSNLNLTVEVKDSSDKPIEGAEIFINDSAFAIGQTNSNGILSKELGLKKGTYTVKAKKGTKVAGQQLIVENYGAKSVSIVLNDTVSEAIQWLVSNQQADGEIGSHKVWGTAFALMALNLNTENASVKQNAMSYLLANQKEDAGFAYPGFDSDALHTAVSIMGLIANNQTLESFSKNGITSTEFLLSKQESDGGFSGWGVSDSDTTAWATLAFVAAGEPMPSKNGNFPADFLISLQNNDGGIPYSAGQSSALDYTAEAIMALGAASYPKNNYIDNAVSFLESNKNSEGCLTNAYTTALGAMALKSYAIDDSDVLHCLETLQLADKGFGRNGINSNAVDTALAAIALGGKTLPITVLDSGDENIIQVESIVQFTVAITNSGRASATNVSINLEGVPIDWIDTQHSTLSITEIKPNETKQANIFVEMKNTGIYSVKAIVSAIGALQDTYSNTLELDVASAELNVHIERQ